MAKKSEHYGHVKISRKAYLPQQLGGDPLWNERRVFSRWEAWEYLIKEATYAARTFVIQGAQTVELARGETRPLAVRHLMKEWGWGSKKRVAAFLAWGQGEGRLRVQQRTQAGDTYFVVNYDKYQAGGDSGGDRVGNGSGDTGGDNTEAGKARTEVSTADFQFERAWEAYPARSGGNPKQPALRAWNARIRERVDPEQIIAGVERYAAYCAAEKLTGMRFVKQAATFFGPAHHYLESWTASPASPVAIVEDLLFLVEHCDSAAMLDLPDTHASLEKRYPAEWSRAGPAFQKLRLRALLNLRGDTKGLRFEMEKQVKGLQDGHR